jgi:hypothetical protein
MEYLCMDKVYKTLALTLFAGVAIVAVLTVKDYGVTWDEPYHNDYGQAVAGYYSSGLKDVPQDMYLNLYGAGFDFPAVLLQKVSPFGAYLTRHILNAAIGIFGIVGAWKTAGLVAGPAAGFWSALLLTLTPCYYGHMFNNPKDLPFAAGYIWSLYYILRVTHYSHLAAHEKRSVYVTSVRTFVLVRPNGTTPRRRRTPRWPDP